MKTLISIKTLAVALILSASSSSLIAQQLDQTLSMVNHLEKKHSAVNLFEQLTQTELLISPAMPGIIRDAYYAHWQKYLTNYLRYPELARQHFIEGTVKVEININAEGEVKSAALVQGLGYGCDEAILDLVRHMPRWTPRLKDGKPTAQVMILPVSFKLTE